MKPPLRLILLLAVALSTLDMVWVLFLGGVNVGLGALTIRSTTIEFRLVVFLVAGILLLVACGKPREALLACGSVVVAALLAEAALQVLDPSLSKPRVRAWYEPSDLFGHRLVANFEGFGPLRVPIRTNARGFRDEEHAWDKDTGTVRILGLGDSFLFGWGVASEQTFLKRLGALLQEATGRRLETINTGVPGWGLNQYLLYLKEFGVRYAPDVVVLAYFIDDLPGAILEAIPASARFRGGVAYGGGPLRHVRLYNLAKTSFDLVRNKNRATRVTYLHDLEARRKKWASPPAYLMSVERRAGDERYERLLREYLTRIRSVAANHGAPLVVLLIPDVSQLFHPEVQYINRLLGGLAREQAIAFVDMTPIFERSPDVREYYLWPLDAHVNGRGHREMARALVEPVCRALAANRVTCATTAATRAALQ